MCWHGGGRRKSIWVLLCLCRTRWVWRWSARLVSRVGNWICGNLMKKLGLWKRAMTIRGRKLGLSKRYLLARLKTLLVLHQSNGQQTPTWLWVDTTTNWKFSTFRNKQFRRASSPSTERAPPWTQPVSMCLQVKTTAWSKCMICESSPNPLQFWNLRPIRNGFRRFSVTPNQKMCSFPVAMMARSKCGTCAIVKSVFAL